MEIAVMMPEQDIIEPEPPKPGIHYIPIKKDHSDAEAQVGYYLAKENNMKLKKIAREGRLWYERNASDSARAHYIFAHCMEVAG